MKKEYGKFTADQFHEIIGIVPELVGMIRGPTRPGTTRWQKRGLRTSVFTTCATPGHPGTARREHPAMNSRTWAAGSRERWWTATPNLRQRTCYPQRPALSAGEVARTWWNFHVFVTFRKTKGLHLRASPCFIWLLNLGSNQGPTD